MLIRSIRILKMQVIVLGSGHKLTIPAQKSLLSTLRSFCPWWIIREVILERSVIRIYEARWFLTIPSEQHPQNIFLSRCLQLPSILGCRWYVFLTSISLMLTVSIMWQPNKSRTEVFPWNAHIVTHWWLSGKETKHRLSNLFERIEQIASGARYSRTETASMINLYPLPPQVRFV